MTIDANTIVFGSHVLNMRFLPPSKAKRPFSDASREKPIVNSPLLHLAM